MAENEIYVSGLIVSQTKDDYGIRYRLRQFPYPIKLEDFKYILEGNKKAKINNQVETFLTTLDDEVEMEECRKEIQAQLRTLFPSTIEDDNQDLETNQFEPDLSVNSWDIFKERLENLIDGRTEDYKFILSIIASYWFINEDADYGIYIILLAPKGKGKSALMGSFKDSKYVICIDNLTMEAWESYL